MCVAIIYLCLALIMSMCPGKFNTLHLFLIEKEKLSSEIRAATVQLTEQLNHLISTIKDLYFYLYLMAYPPEFLLQAYRRYENDYSLSYTEMLDKIGKVSTYHGSQLWPWFTKVSPDAHTVISHLRSTTLSSFSLWTQSLYGPSIK